MMFLVYALSFKIQITLILQRLIIQPQAVGLLLKTAVGFMLWGLVVILRQPVQRAVNLQAALMELASMPLPVELLNFAMPQPALANYPLKAMALPVV
jgi:hypothetical protein